MRGSALRNHACILMYTGHMPLCVVFDDPNRTRHLNKLVTLLKVELTKHSVLCAHILEVRFLSDGILVASVVKFPKLW
jgi:hypothetical protein